MATEPSTRSIQRLAVLKQRLAAAKSGRVDGLRTLYGEPQATAGQLEAMVQADLRDWADHYRGRGETLETCRARVAPGVQIR